MVKQLRDFKAKRIIEPDDIDVMSWSPGAEGANVPCTQVHLMINIQKAALFIMRYKSREALNILIDALIDHRDYVWPEGEKKP